MEETSPSQSSFTGPTSTPTGSMESPSPSSTTTETPAPPAPPKKRRGLFTALLVANLAVVLPTVLIEIALTTAANHGASGTEFLGLLLWPLFLTSLFIVVLDLIAIPIYLIYIRPKGIRLVVLIAVFLGLLFVVGRYVASLQHADNLPAADAVAQIKACKVRYVDAPSIGQPEVILVTVDSQGRTQNEEKTKPENWPVIKAAIYATHCDFDISVTGLN